MSFLPAFPVPTGYNVTALQEHMPGSTPGFAPLSDIQRSRSPLEPVDSCSETLPNLTGYNLSGDAATGLNVLWDSHFPEGALVSLTSTPVSVR